MEKPGLYNLAFSVVKCLIKNENCPCIFSTSYIENFAGLEMVNFTI